MAVAKSNGFLNCLDLFSGIAGFSIALKGITNTIAYCDNAIESQAALASLMERNLIHTAPICNDVIDIDKAWLSKNCQKSIDIIVAGFPCVGFSSYGQLQGFQNSESALFQEVLRIIDISGCDIVFLENVPNIINMGIQLVINELSVKRKFELRWCVVKASDVGAQHVRARWFCLAIRNPRKLKQYSKTNLEYIEYPWNSKNNSPPRLVKNNKLNKYRLGLLGNSVVPDAVRYAFFYLASCYNPVNSLNSFIYNECPVLNTSSEKNKLTRNTIIQTNGNIISQPKCILLRNVPRKTLTFDPNIFIPHKPPSQHLKLELLNHQVISQFWSTPRHSNIYGANYLTKRTVRDLPSQVRFEKYTKDSIRHGMLSAEFVEYLMGYPIGWTNFKLTDKFLNNVDISL